MKSLREHTKNGYFKFTMSLVAAGTLIILIHQLIVNRTDVSANIEKMVDIISPFIYGLLMAYLLAPIYNFSVRNSYRLVNPYFRKKKSALMFSRVFGTAASLLVLSGIVAGFFALVIPELMRDRKSVV